MTRYKRPIKRGTKADPQQFRLYRMESADIGARHWLKLTKRDTQRVVRSLCKSYGIKPIKVVFEDLGRWAAEWRAPRTIVFGCKKTSRDLLTAAHEFAHQLHHDVAGADNDHQNHGPEFMACYMGVLDTIRFLPIDSVAAICDKRRVKYIRPREGAGVDQLRALISKETTL